MSIERVEISVTLPRDLWEQLRQQAQAAQEDEATVLIRAIEQFLQQEVIRAALAERLRRECEELGTLEFDDLATEDEWLVVQNEALNKAEIDLS